jgi:YHS domain-containing protein
MLRFILLSILLTILFRAVSRLWAGVVRGMQSGNPSAGRRTDAASVPQRGVHMVRDPICGTFVVPERAVALSAGGGQRLYFCSTDCRDKYRSQSESNHAPAHGRTA